MDSVDALHVLRTVVGLAHDEPCAAPQDVDCSGHINAVDALKILRFAAGLSVSQHEPCTNIGDSWSCIDFNSNSNCTPF